MSDFVINKEDSKYHNDKVNDHPFYLWFYWILAHTFGVLIGLGAVFLIATGIAPGIETYMGTVADLIIIGILIIVGTLVEGTVLGTVQWIVIQNINEDLKWLAWVNATLIGVFVAWALGTIPNSLIDFGVEGIKTTLDPSNVLQNYLIVGGLGIVLGSVIGFPQWLLLRLYFDHTEWWVPVNAAAWMFGMVIIFTGVEMAAQLDQGLKTASVLIITLAVSGALMGAINGIALLRMTPTSTVSNNPDQYGYSID